MFDSVSLIDEIVKKINLLLDASGLQKCIIAVEVAQMLTALQDGLKKDAAQKNREEMNQNGSK